MVEKFKKIHHFLKETWLGFDTIADLEEEEPETKKDKNMKIF